VEGKTQEEIDAIKTSIVVEPTTEEVLNDLITTLVNKGVLY
jgi:hypothetical protein